MTTGGGTVNVRGPSEAQNQLASEQASLLREQRDILSQQLRQQSLLAPLLFKSAGITPIVDKSGQTVGFAQQSDPLADQAKQIQGKLNERTLAALEGKLPDNPALLSDLARQETTLNEQLRKQLGPGYQLSTPAAGPGGALPGFFQAKENILESARRGDISTAEALGLAQTQSNQQTLNNFLQRATGISGFQFGNPGMALSQLFTQAQAPLLQQQGFGLQANALNAQIQNQNQMALMGGIGNLAGLGLFAPSFSGTTGRPTNLFGTLFSGGGGGTPLGPGL